MTDLAALDQAVEAAWDDFENALRDNFNLYPTPGRREKCRAALESAITARAVAQEQARRAKLVAVLESVHSKLDDAFVDAASDHPRFLLDSDIRDLMYPIERALAADREQSERDTLREGL